MIEYLHETIAGFMDKVKGYAPTLVCNPLFAIHDENIGLLSDDDLAQLLFVTTR